MSPPSRRRGSKPVSHRHLPITKCRLHHGGVDRNQEKTCFICGADRRLHHGGVDRNPDHRQDGARRADVASITEAWIETRRIRRSQIPRRVASITEAWIETNRSRDSSARMVSPPSRRRGSKQREPGGGGADPASPPSRRRGSKHRQPRTSSPSRRVASITEAWIETRQGGGHPATPLVASITEAWIETAQSTRRSSIRSSPPSRRRGSKHWTSNRRVRSPSRLHHGGVDRNQKIVHGPEADERRLHHGGVDRN